MKIRLLPKFIISLGVIGLVMTVAISLFSYATSKSYLENMYAERVMTNSNAIAAMLPTEDVKTIIASEGDKTDAYKKAAALFNKLKKDGNVTFLSLVVPDEDSVHFYIDAMVEEMGDSPENQLAYGSDMPYTEAANPDDPRDMEKYITIWKMYAYGIFLAAYGGGYSGAAVLKCEHSGQPCKHLCAACIKRGNDGVLPCCNDKVQPALNRYWHFIGAYKSCFLRHYFKKADKYYPRANARLR